MKFVKSIFTVCSYRVYLHFDHHLTTTVQAAPQNVGKACCDNQQWAFSRFGLNCTEPTNFTFLRRSIPSCRSSPTRKARGSNPPGRTKSSTLWGAALFVFGKFGVRHYFTSSVSLAMIFLAVCCLMSPSCA